MQALIELLLIKLFNNPFGRLYLSVPKGKKIYKITKGSAHYFTGEIAKNGLPIICTGDATPGGLKIFRKFAFAGKFLGIISVFTLSRFVILHIMLPFFALTDTGALPPASNQASSGTQYTNPQNVYTDDSNYAIGSYQNNQLYYNFNFGVTAGATINGYEITSKGNYVSGGTRVSFYDPMELFVGSSDDRGSIGSQTNLNLTTDTTVTFGSSSTLPSTPLTVTEINNNTSAGINVRLQTSNTGGTGVPVVSINYLTVKIYYTVSHTYTQTMTETISLTDTIAKAATKLLAEAITLTDTIIHSITRILPTESLTLTDVLSALDVKLKELNDSLGLIDTFGRAMQTIKSEAITLTDTITTAFTQVKILSETISLTDTFSRSLQWLRTLTETISLTDYLSILWNGLPISEWVKYLKPLTNNFSKFTKPLVDRWNKYTKTDS